MCAAPLASLARDQEEQNNVEWLPKLNAHAQNVLGATQHCFAPLDPSRGQQEEPHTQFARRMETKVVVATMWLSVGIGITLKATSRSSNKRRLPSHMKHFGPIRAEVPGVVKPK